MKNNLNEFINKINLKEYQSIVFSENTSILNTHLTIGDKEIKNRIVFQPMEGCDGNYDGSPSELTVRRYTRFAKSGAGLIWFEAVCVCKEGKANPRQLFLNENNKQAFKEIVAKIKEICYNENGFEPIIIMQATHSGRYSKPNGVPEPIIAYNNPLFETTPIDAKNIISDDDCDNIISYYEKTAKLARECGFDGIDIKCCHRYLFNEFLSAYTRSGRYGGSFENRTKLYFSCISAAKQFENKDFFVTSRVNVYDGFPYPYGFGVDSSGNNVEPCFDESEKLLSELTNKFNFKLLNITIGNPYVNPHVNRPFNVGPYKNPENKLAGVNRIAYITSHLAKKYPNLNIILSGVTALKEFAPNYGAGMIESGNCALVGFGRLTFSYPDFVKDLFNNGEIKKEKCCVACSKCSEMMRAGKVAGCPVFDAETYLDIFKEIKK